MLLCFSRAFFNEVEPFEYKCYEKQLIIDGIFVRNQFLLGFNIFRYLPITELQNGRSQIQDNLL